MPVSPVTPLILTIQLLNVDWIADLIRIPAMALNLSPVYPSSFSLSLQQQQKNSIDYCISHWSNVLVEFSQIHNCFHFNAYTCLDWSSMHCLKQYQSTLLSLNPYKKQTLSLSLSTL